MYCFENSFQLYLQMLFLNRKEQLDNTELEEEIQKNGTMSGTATLSRKSNKNKRHSKIKLSGSKLNFGDATDDVHVCIMCLRAIMNHQV